ncbi:MAG TPA: peptide chain release factor N(5)-glutamine methyltransferase [Bacteroidales bacterium]|nr:peptide chain release factor N(5)-glutamine methyltransferase [Bacteroidales bacterium]
MNKEQKELFERYKETLGERLVFLGDKPEENAESTLKALWFLASGVPISAKLAFNKELPELNPEQMLILEKIVQKRLSNIPLSHITRRQNFLDIEFITDSRALIPREETEILGKKVLEIVDKISQKSDYVKVIDICCGCGNLGLAVANYNPKAQVQSSDLSEQAVELARENAGFLNLADRVQIKPGDLFEAFENDDHYNQTDVIICNPPYISSAKVQKMNSEISENEPQLAFDGGMLGTKIIQRLIREAPKFLKTSGWVAFEIGLGQGKFVYDLCIKSGLYTLVDCITDKENQIRVIVAQK